MENWSELPRDLLSAIARRLEAATDRARFSGVCRNWSSLAKSEINYLTPNPPWLMMTGKPDSDYRDFVSADGKCFALKFPRNSRCLGSSGCWLVIMDMDFDLYVINPFSGSRIDLPSLLPIVIDYIERDGDLDLFSKVILYFPKSPEEDFIAVAIHETCKLVYTKNGAKSWQSIEFNDCVFVDVIFFQDKIYALEHNGRVSELKLDCSPDEKPKTVPVSVAPQGTCFFNKGYLVEFQGLLLQIINMEDVYFNGKDMKGFHVYKLDFSTGEWVKLNDLGQYSCFIGCNNGVSLLADSNSTFKPNCIYFSTDDCVKIQVGDELSYNSIFGVFNLADSIFSLYSEDHYSEFIYNRPTWIIPTSLSKNQ